MEYKSELIVCIVNAGFSAEVMEIAHSLGVTGGTIIHARGTANKEAENVFKITINPEKDMIFIVSKKELAEKVIKEVYAKVGLGTDANGVAFTMPVTNQVGIK